MIEINSSSIPAEKSFKNAIVRLPCPEMIYGLSYNNLGLPFYAKALEQHSEYIEALKYCGLSVSILEYDSRFPDSTFVEDVALCSTRCAIITNPGVPTRTGETEGIREILAEFFNDIENVVKPGTLEAGDVMMVAEHFFIGVSGRTNDKGADQLIDILRRYGYTGSKVFLKMLLHLKSGASYLENNNMLLTGELVNAEEFSRFNRIIVPEDEKYAANSIWINGKVLVPLGFPKTRRQIEKAGYESIILDVSEFRKLDGGLSCLSLRF